MLTAALRRLLLCVSFLLAAVPETAAQVAEPAGQPIQANELAADLYLIADRSGNLLVLLGEEGTVVVGAPEPARLARARQLIEERGAAPVRFAIVTSSDSMLEWGDGGWEREGALSIAHEHMRDVMRRRVRPSAARTHAHAHAPLDRSAWFGVPSIGYSHVFQLRINDEELHVVHQPPSFTNADASVHLHQRRVLFMGNLFTTDGYPAINLERRGTLRGFVEMADGFIDLFGEDGTMVEPIVPGRGPLATMADFIAFRAMLVEVRDLVEPMVREGRTLEEVVAARPTAAFDARWGNGPVSPDDFVSAVYGSLARERARTAPRGGG
jgi:cyclase